MIINEKLNDLDFLKKNLFWSLWLFWFNGISVTGVSVDRLNTI